jgi:hypothetical protein
MLRKRNISAVAVALGLAGGSVAFAVDRSGQAASDPAADRAALAANAHSSVGSFFRGYTRVTEALPNAKDRDGRSVNDSVVVGTVTAVADGAGYDETGKMPIAGHPGARVTSFDDPLADWRTLAVTVDVGEAVAGPRSSQLVLSWPLMGNSARGDDKEEIGRALKSLGRIVVFSTARPAAPEYLGIARDIPDRPYGVAVVASDGSLSFPFIGTGGAAEVEEKALMGGVDTLPELRAEAAKPAWQRPAN